MGLGKDQIKQVYRLLEDGSTPEAAACELGMARNTLVIKLLESGKRMRPKWHLEDVVPVDISPDREEALS